MFVCLRAVDEFVRNSALTHSTPVTNTNTPLFLSFTALSPGRSPVLGRAERDTELPERHRLAVEPDARVAGPQPPAATVTPVPAVVVVPNPQGTRAHTVGT